VVNIAAKGLRNEGRNMQIVLNVMLAEGDDVPTSAEDAAMKVLDALGGDPAKDHCTVSVSMMPTTVSVGTLPDFASPSTLG
jgi:hypothetical protein